MGTVKGTEGVSPGEEKALGTPSPPEGKRLDILCAPQGRVGAADMSQGSRFEPEIEECCPIT